MIGDHCLAEGSLVGPDEESSTVWHQQCSTEKSFKCPARSLLPMSSDLMETTLAMVSDVNIIINWLLAFTFNEMELFLQLHFPLMFYLSFDQQIRLSTHMNPFNTNTI